MMVTSCVIGSVTGVEAQQIRPSPLQPQAGNPLRQQRILQLRKEVERAERKYQKSQAHVKKLERYEKPAAFIKRGADAAVEAGHKIAPADAKGSGMSLDFS
jgi:hypothetical protein